MAVERLRERFGRRMLGIGRVVVVGGLCPVKIEIVGWRVEERRTGRFVMQLWLGIGTVVVGRISGMTVVHPRF